MIRKSREMVMLAWLETKLNVIPNLLLLCCCPSGISYVSIRRSFRAPLPGNLTIFLPACLPPLRLTVKFHHLLDVVLSGAAASLSLFVLALMIRAGESGSKRASD